MKLNVSDALRNPGQEYRFAGEQEIEPYESFGETVTFDPAQVEGVYFTSGDMNVTVDGQLRVVAHGRCAHCLEPASVTIEVPFTETFIRDGDPEDDESFEYKGYQVDLAKLALSYAAVELPLRMLCKEDCPPPAGTEELDELDTKEQELPVQYPFAALKDLLAQDTETDE